MDWQSKTHLRRMIKEDLKKVQFQTINSKIKDKLIDFFKGVDGKKILTYKPLKFEPDISGLNNILEQSNELFWPDNGDIKIHRDGEVFKEFDFLDYIIVPALGLTREGKRLGRGGGWYDRVLKDINALKISPVFSVQVVHNLPEEDFDQRVDIIVTESELIKCKTEK